MTKKYLIPTWSQQKTQQKSKCQQTKIFYELACPLGEHLSNNNNSNNTHIGTQPMLYRTD